MMKTIGEVNLKGIQKIKSGKVREMFLLEENLLIVTTDRISAFDYVLPSLIPYKGILLNQISILFILLYYQFLQSYSSILIISFIF